MIFLSSILTSQICEDLCLKLTICMNIQNFHLECRFTSNKEIKQGALPTPALSPAPRVLSPMRADRPPPSAGMWCWIHTCSPCFSPAPSPLSAWTPECCSVKTFCEVLVRHSMAQTPSWWCISFGVKTKVLTLAY